MRACDSRRSADVLVTNRDDCPCVSRRRSSRRCPALHVLRRWSQAARRTSHRRCGSPDTSAHACRATCVVDGARTTSSSAPVRSRFSTQPRAAGWERVAVPRAWSPSVSAVAASLSAHPRPTRASRIRHSMLLAAIRAKARVSGLPRITAATPPRNRREALRRQAPLRHHVVDLPHSRGSSPGRRASARVAARGGETSRRTRLGAAEIDRVAVALRAGPRLAGANGGVHGGFYYELLPVMAPRTSDRAGPRLIASSTCSGRGVVFTNQRADAVSYARTSSRTPNRTPAGSLTRSSSGHLGRDLGQHATDELYLDCRCAVGSALSAGVVLGRPAVRSPCPGAYLAWARWSRSSTCRRATSKVSGPRLARPGIDPEMSPPRSHTARFAPPACHARIVLWCRCCCACVSTTMPIPRAGDPQSRERSRGCPPAVCPTGCVGRGTSR